jgi:GTP pyrophosphokinase
MGISSLKIELEDLCFRYYRPDMYYELSQKVKKTEAERGRYIDDVKDIISIELQKSHFKFEVFGRSKHLWSIYKKMQHRNIDYEQLYDVLAFRVIVENVAECYGVLGLVHSLWKPIPGRFKDFIAMPKANNYQSLHTTVMGPGGERIEIQIRTREMNLVAERGIAAHWKYKERGQVDDDSEFQQVNWLKDLVNSHQQVKNADEFLDSVKTDLFDTEIYVFTPKGDIREFPEGASPLNFAYAVHTELGNKCVGARVNGKMVPLRYRLQNGDTIEIVTSKTQVPSKDWLKYAVTNKAKQKIRQYVKEEQRRRSLTLGKDLIEKEFRKFGMAAGKHLKGPEYEVFLKENGLKDLEELYVKVGYGRLEPRHLVDRVSPASLAKVAAKTDETTFMEKVVKAAAQKTRRSNSLVSVEGMDDVLVHFAKCCHPIPGDSISGFISRGRGITIHRSDCSKGFELDQLRKVDVAWTSAQALEGQERMVRVRVISHDVPGLLKSMSEVFSVQGINIESAQIRTTKDKKAVCNFEVSVRDATQLNNAIYELQKIKGILGVTRVFH